MQEDFLHYIWKYKKFDVYNLQTVHGEQIDIKSSGEHNVNSGPDFFNTQIKIDGQLWAGNVEIHIKSSDWFVHNHEQDLAYQNVILHVVWEHDMPIYRKNNEMIPVLELKKVISNSMLSNYRSLFSKSNKWINCENDFGNISPLILENWLERLYFERLEKKSIVIKDLLEASKNDWEAVLFKLLAKSFGLKVNGDAFMSMANSFDFSILRKLQSNIIDVEALLFGQAGLLDINIGDGYFQELYDRYDYLRHKFQLSNQFVLSFQYFRLRPNNFPTIRLSQLANLYSGEPNLFSKIITIKTNQELYDLFSVYASNYWDSHYNFGIESKKHRKRLSKSFIDLLLINTIIPLKFSYAKHKGGYLSEDIINLIQNIASEKNSIIEKFHSFKTISKSALESQALLQLKHHYCDKNKCMHCAIGNSLLNRK